MEHAKTVLVCIGLFCSAAAADIVRVRIDGEVEFNGIRSGIFAGVGAGQPVAIDFDVDSNVFTNGAMFPTRGYHMITSSFTFAAGSASVGLQSPPVETPMFILRNNDPQVDGFFFGTSPDAGFPNGVALNEPGRFGPFRSNYLTTYEGSRLSSLDILGALGTYDFTGLQVFGFTLVDGGFDAMGVLFEQMTITPAPGAAVLLGPLAILAQRRRRGGV